MANKTEKETHVRKRKVLQSQSEFKQPKKFKRVEHGDRVLSLAPQSVNIVDFVERRATEIIAMTKSVQEITGTRLVSQRLPRHMRRRALSHDVRRLPKRCREAAAKEIEKSRSTKRPSRKHRRRPKNLMSDYERRKRHICWLETHIWHAKRFHMVDKWGYRLALHPNDKSVRACHRAADKYCLLQDVSYEFCIEITGKEEILCRCLKHLFSDETGPTILAKLYRSGQRWGENVLYTCDKYPLGAVGVVAYLWRPRTCDEDMDRQLWIWGHPACYDQVWRELQNSIMGELLEVGNGSAVATVQKCMEGSLDKHPEESPKRFDATDGIKNDSTEKTLPGQTVKEDTVEVRGGVSSRTTDASLLQPENGSGDDAKKDDSTGGTLPCQTLKEDTVKAREFEHGGVKLRSLKDNLVKFRLTGQNTQAVVNEVLQPSDVSETDSNSSFWWQKYYSIKANRVCNTSQLAVADWMKTCHSPADVPPHQVTAMTVRDPRLLLPLKRTKVMPDREVDGVGPRPAVDECHIQSPLWLDGVRHDVKSSKMPEHELNKLRAANLVPGTPVNLGLQESRIPVILMQRPGFRLQAASGSHQHQPKHGFGCGWDVIIPAGWARAFLIAFVFRGSRVGGLQESASVSRESGSFHYPQDFPDTAAGQGDSEEQRQKLLRKYNRNPPAKRPNYVKLGVQFPFNCPWSKLVTEWQEVSGVEEPDENLVVLRNIRCLQLLNEVCSVILKKDDQQKNRYDACTQKEELSSLGAKYPAALVAVRLAMYEKGVPTQFAQVSIPRAEDLELLDKDEEKCCPCEPKHLDREALRKKREKKLKKKLRAVSMPSNPLEKSVASILQDSTNKVSAMKHEGSEDQAGKDKLINYNIREVVGFVNDGEFSLSQGHGKGKGLCSLLGLIKLLKVSPANKPCFVLVRNTTSLQYRLAYLSIVLS